MIIGVSGVARSGKDTFFSLLKKELSVSRRDLNVSRYAFADQIKLDLRSLLLENFNIDINQCSPEEKEIIRPLLVAYGSDVARTINPDFWISKLSKKLKTSQVDNQNIDIITDVRYPNEQEFIKNNFKKSCCVHIERFGFGPANSEEEKNNPLLKSNSDYTISWNTFGDRTEVAAPLIHGFINEKIRK